MPTLSIHLYQNRTNFEPCDIIWGHIQWELDLAAQNGSLSFLWSTKGKGNEDIGVIEVQELDLSIETPPLNFKFVAPNCPYSFSGTLISLVWAIELQIGNIFKRQEITIAPAGQEILIQ